MGSNLLVSFLRHMAQSRYLCARLSRKADDITDSQRVPKDTGGQSEGGGTAFFPSRSIPPVVRSVHLSYRPDLYPHGSPKLLLLPHKYFGKYRAPVKDDVKGSVLYFWKFALPPFSPPLPSVGEFSEQNKHRTFDIILYWSPVYRLPQG